MSKQNPRSSNVERAGLALAAALLLAALPIGAVQPDEPATEVGQRAFFKPELYIAVTNTPLAGAGAQLANGGAWQTFLADTIPEAEVFLDLRSGVPTNIIAPMPLFPGSGFGNRLTLDEVSAQLVRPVETVDAEVVADLVRAFVVRHQDVLAVDVRQLGEARATRVNDQLWHVQVPQVAGGIPVRHSRLAGTISHGNLSVFGGEVWGNVTIGTEPTIAAGEALDAGFAYLGGRSERDTLHAEPRLEIIPYAPPEHQAGDAFAGPTGAGYGHYLAWVFTFERAGDLARWEVIVDAHTGEVLALQDTNQYASRNVKGGIYPHTATEICPDEPPYSLFDNRRCGEMQATSNPNPVFNAYPMPWTDTAQSAPDDFTNGNGVYNWTVGSTATTTLTGIYDRINDNCGPISESSTTGFIDLGGANADHDCTAAGTSAGNTSSSRTVFNSANKIAQVGRGWLPGNTWLQNQLLANVNINANCNAFWSGSINFFTSGGGCRNTGEILAVVDHEWGHGLDANDTNGTLSNPSEAYADIAAVYRGHDSCVGYGFWQTFNTGCGMTSDGTGFNANEAQVGPAHCVTECSGVRDADFARHVDGIPDTPQNHTCPRCFTSSGPCGRQVHCAAAPIRQAAFDLPERDLPAAPLYKDENSAYIIANKLFYQGSGNINLWHSCSCSAGTSDGCGANSGYMSWLAADDDNGNVNDGTPHMTAIHAAYDRHNIACGTPAPFNNGCFGGPTQAPAKVELKRNASSVTIAWSAVPNATRYWVLRSEGVFGCSTAKALIATVNGTSYVDTDLLPGFQYCYTIIGAGASDACFGDASTCVCTEPFACRADVAPKTLLKEDFSAGIPATWTVVDGGSGGGASATWNTANPCALSIPAPIASPWAEVNSQCAGLGATQDEQLITPTIDVSKCLDVELRFDSQFAWNQVGNREFVDVDVTVNSTGNSGRWFNVLRLENGSDGHPNPVTKVLDLRPRTKGAQKLQVRFHYYDGSGDGWWAVDNVQVRCLCPRTILPSPTPVPEEQ